MVDPHPPGQADHARQGDAGHRAGRRRGAHDGHRRGPGGRAHVLPGLGAGRGRRACSSASTTASPRYYIGYTTGLRAFTSAVLGGIGSIPGAVLGGLCIGLTQSLGGQLLGVKWTDVMIFSILIVIMVFRPSGLLGVRAPQKAERGAGGSARAGWSAGARCRSPGGGRSSRRCCSGVGLRSRSLSGNGGQRGRGGQRLHLRPAGARPQHRRRLRGSARPGLRRVLRHRRLRLRDRGLRPAQAGVVERVGAARVGRPGEPPA